MMTSAHYAKEELLGIVTRDIDVIFDDEN